jgi:hypothetical protein
MESGIEEGRNKADAGKAGGIIQYFRLLES